MNDRMKLIFYLFIFNSFAKIFEGETEKRSRLQAMGDIIQ